MTRLLRRGDLVFDVGAHTGGKAAAFLADGARVVCVEPQPRCVAALRERFSGSPRLAIEPVGLGANEGTLVLSICSRSDVLSTFTENWKHGRFAEFAWDEQVEVPISTLDRLIARHGVPRFCKIDVEGFELEVLRGLSQPIPYVSIEYAIEFRAATEACVHRLESLGFQRFNVSVADSGLLSFPEWCASARLLRWLAAEPDPMAWGDIYASAELNPRVTRLPNRSTGLLRRAVRRLVALYRSRAT